MQISSVVKQHDDIKLRMGIHSGMVYRSADINKNMSVSGGGISLAQQVMDFGDAGHILVSKRVADDLSQLSRWSNCFKDLGQVTNNEGSKLHIFNLNSDGLGNPELPGRFRRTPATFFTRNLWWRPAALVFALTVGLSLLAFNYWSRSNSSPTAPAAAAGSSAAPAAGKEQSLAYWLTVQKMKDKKEVGSPIESTGNLLFEKGWTFRFNLRTSQSGYFYLLNVGPNQNGEDEYNVLFPTTKNNNGSAAIAANQIKQTEWYEFTEKPGVEKLWIIWSEKPLADLEAIFKQADSQDGVIKDAQQIERVKTFLNSQTNSPEVTPDEAKNLTTVKGHGETLVSVVELYHKPQS
jgi:hypothetical protein